MTEEKWLATTNPSLLLARLGVSAGDRKRRLFAVACCRRIEHLILQHKGAWRAVVLGERIADGMPITQEARDLRPRLAETAFTWIDGFRPEKLNNVAYHAINAAGYCLSGIGADTGMASIGSMASTPDAAAHAAGHWERRNDRNQLQKRWVKKEHIAQVLLAHCMFGNPFRPVAIDPSWLTSTVVALARGIYDDRAFDRTPILADALQDAGCDNDDVLTHLRGDGPHARGCWVIDLLLGKS